MGALAQTLPKSANLNLLNGGECQLPKYDFELEVLPATYNAATRADVDHLKAAIAGASQSSLIAVGSGGSFTVATVMCNLHEIYTGHVSRPSTPLEIICNPDSRRREPGVPDFRGR